MLSPSDNLIKQRRRKKLFLNLISHKVFNQNEANLVKKKKIEKKNVFIDGSRQMSISIII